MISEELEEGSDIGHEISAFFMFPFALFSRFILIQISKGTSQDQPNYQELLREWRNLDGCGKVGRDLYGECVVINDIFVMDG